MMHYSDNNTLKINTGTRFSLETSLLCPFFYSCMTFHEIRSHGILIKTFPPFSPSPYTDNFSASLLLNKNPNNFPPSFSTCAPVRKLYVAPQKSHCSLASLDSLAGNTLPLVSGILQQAQEAEKQYVVLPLAFSS